MNEHEHHNRNHAADVAATGTAKDPICDRRGRPEGAGAGDDPFFGILIGPIFAAFAMSASSVSVVGNALRLRSVKIWKGSTMAQQSAPSETSLEMASLKTSDHSSRSMA